MGRRCMVEKLPADILVQLQDRLTKSNHSDFAALEFWLKEIGYEITDSSIHRYSQKMRKIEEAPISEEENNRKTDLRMRCLEVASVISPSIDVIDTAEKLFLWVTTGQKT